MEKIYLYEHEILNHLQVASEAAVLEHGSDTYFLEISKFVSDSALDTRVQKTKEWVERYGGKFEVYPEKFYQMDKKGYVVKIVFPMTGNRTHGRNMKEIMSTLYYGGK